MLFWINRKRVWDADYPKVSETSTGSFSELHSICTVFDAFS